MQTISILFIFIAVFASLAVSWYVYYFKSLEKNNATTIVLFLLRSLGIFLLLVLLINPAITTTKLTTVKPILTVLVDNSLSINYFKKEDQIKSLVAKFRQNKALNDKFDIQYYRFGNDLAVLDTLTFKDSQTDIYQAISGVAALHKNTKSPIVLVSDGNQTTGDSYQYYKSANAVYPIVIGDTTTQQDLRIEQINVNKYSYLQNKFPVEIRIIYEGNQSISSTFQLFQKEKSLFKKTISFTKKNNVQTLSTTLLSSNKGVQYYTATILPLKDEKNTQNNSKSFSVEVLNERTNILLLSAVIHPDIGALKKSIETNKQRTVTVKNILTDTFKLTDYQLVILYQPNQQFNRVFKEIQNKKIHNFIITGTATNWNFLNEVQSNFTKNNIPQVEEYAAIFNPGFLSFNQKDITFATFPPLKDQFGTLQFNVKIDALLYQNINGLNTKTPLLATFEKDSQKSVVLFGEGIWKWRAASFINSGGFQDFDALLSNLVQYAASTQKRKRLKLEYENSYTANSSIAITAFYIDKNYLFDPRASLELKLVNTTTKTQQNIPFSLQNNSFEAVLNDLPAGDYQFTVFVQNETVQQSGSFKIMPFQIENQFTKANVKDLSALAILHKQQLYFPSNQEQLATSLLVNNQYSSTQKAEKTKEELINWKILLFCIIAIFTAEWFIRKYRGLI